MIFYLSLALALSATNGGTDSRTATPPTSAPIAQAEPKKEKKICRKLGKAASRLDKPVCKTETEWAAFSKSNGKNWGDVKKD